MGSTSNNWIKTHKLSLVDENSNTEYTIEIDNKNLCIKQNNEINLEIEPQKKIITNNIFNIKQHPRIPDKPNNEKSIILLSNGDGDLMISSNVNGETLYNRLFDFEQSRVWF